MNQEKSKGSGGFMNGFIRFSDRWIPNSMVLVLLLTLLVAVLAEIFCGNPFCGKESVFRGLTIRKTEV